MPRPGYGIGTFAGRAGMETGPAVHQAAQQLKDPIFAVAGARGDLAVAGILLW